VIRARGNVGDFVLGKDNLSRLQGDQASTLNNATSKLVLLTGTPGPDVSFCVKSNNVVFSTFKLGNFLDFWD